MDEFSLKILAKYRTRKSLTLTQLGAILNYSPVDLAQYVLRLMELSYLCVDPTYAKMHDPDPDGLIGVNVPLQLTISGNAELEAVYQKEKERRQDRIRYLINTVISVSALILSIISIVKQL